MLKLRNFTFLLGLCELKSIKWCESGKRNSNSENHTSTKKEAFRSHKFQPKLSAANFRKSPGVASKFKQKL